MSEEILINITPPETRVAVIENGVLQELIIERVRQKGLVGNVYKGEVCRVLPGMQAAFVDIGLEKAAFLHLSDFNSQELAIGSENIEHYLREGQTLVVQVTKDPLGNKGARLTTDISIPSRYQVYMPYASNSGVSQRIECDEERLRLRNCIEGYLQKHNVSGGFIARTAAECVEAAILYSDMTFLHKLWESILDKSKKAKVKTLIHEDLPLSIRTLRDLYKEGIEKVRIDSRETFLRLIEFAETFVPEMVSVIEHYSGERPL